MKVLVATKETQGERDNDFCWSKEGEFVYFGFECCNTTSCGCSWSFSGMESRRATTTAKVVEKDITVEEFTKALRESHAKAYGGYMDDDALDRGAAEDAEQILKIASLYEVGAVIRRGADRTVGVL